MNVPPAARAPLPAPAAATHARPALILASASPRRVALLAQLGITPDQVIATAIDETSRPEELPRLYAQRMARAKAQAARAVAGPEGLILAADTVVAAGRRILPKAETEEQARTCLALLSGRRHQVLTAVVLLGPDGRQSERTVDSVVAFVRLSQPQQEIYLAGTDWHGKAGGYAIQGSAASFIRFLSGSYSNVVGLPLFETAQLLRGHGWLRP